VTRGNRKLPRVLILWGVSGVGKSTFANWLVKEKGFVRVDSDAGGAGDSRAANAWRAMLHRLGTQTVGSGLPARKWV
jgi:adenylate kinase family enzyme